MQRLRAHAANRFRRHALGIWQSRGGGFYGFVVLLTFLYLEGVDLAGDLAALPGQELGLGFLLGFLIDNLVDAVVNGVRAAIWPVSWIGAFGLSVLSGMLLAGCWVTYRAIRPTVIRLLTPTDEPAPALERPLA